ncbi:GntR family transcriptional regulator [Pleomorphomonas sp. NRK KF1]|uniref:GntR family transcriptional regulator n=1 Tax=Pleomorphomonas sp. NRK KF1 TaxID=2943000 RepID=UPI00204346DD|nr:GntR family transcriptional regulator [Pleomorphomonas sp. NRK KF1]MCM5554586.1 GntR family transcriptional regulator [Pleomorphomonas sp. NRK KF1]
MMEPFTRVVGQDWRERGGDAPLCRCLEVALRAAISSGRLVAGMPLPSERAIAAGLSISRITVRQAMAPLVAEGLVTTRPGGGSTVAGGGAAGKEEARPSDAAHRRQTVLRSHADELAEKGESVETRLVDRLTGPPSAPEAMTLGLGPGERVLRLYRLHCVEGRPRILELTTLPAASVDVETATVSPAAALANAGLPATRGVERFRAVALGAVEAGLLELPEGTPAMRVERVSYTAGGRAVEISRAFCRGDGYEVVAALSGE